MTTLLRLRAAGVAIFFAAQSGLAAAPVAVAAPAHPRLDRLRLLPEVLVEGEKGWTLEERMKRYKVEAVSVAVFAGGRILWTEARGAADREAGAAATPETLFQAGSISKPVAAAAVLREVERGAFRLDADINEYLKSWKLPEGGAAKGQRVTLERLLSHRAGLTVHGFPGYEAGKPVPTVAQILDGAAPANTEPVRVAFEPGTKFQYSGGGYTIAQLALTDALSRPFPELLRELVLAPAGMTHSAYEQPLPPAKLPLAAAGYRRDGAPIPGKRNTYPEMAAAGLWTTPEDLARFAIAIQRSLAGEKNALLTKESARKMTTPIADGPNGLGLFLDTREGATWFGHDGADEGFQALLVASRDGTCRCGIAVMANSDNGVRLGQEIVRGIARESGWKYMPAPLPVAKLEATELARLSGRFRVHGDEVLSISVKDGRLLGAAGSEDQFDLVPTSRDALVRTDRRVRYEIERDPSGGVTAIHVVSPDGATVARRMSSDDRLPSEDLEAGRVQEALVGYRVLFAESPADPGIAEPRLNGIGYHLAMTGQPARALAILKLTGELYPGSANAWDSLAEVSLDQGDRETARSASRKVLEVLPSDPKPDAALKDRLRALAEKRLADLGAPR